MARKKRIFIVDDDEYVQEILRYLVVYRSDYDVVSFNDGVSVLECMDKEVPDLLMIDYMLPGMTGVDICKKVREDERMRGVPIIMMSACARSLMGARGVLGVDSLLAKPFDVSMVLSEIERLLMDRQGVAGGNHGTD